MVLLKIPTKNLDINKIRCRAQIFNGKMSEEHETYGDFATNQKHYSRNKCPIEYIYEDNIPIDNIEKVGTLNSKIQIKKNKKAKTWENIQVFKFLKKLFNNRPELKAIKLGENSNPNFQYIE